MCIKFVSLFYCFKFIFNRIGFHFSHSLLVVSLFYRCFALIFLPFTELLSLRFELECERVKVNEDCCWIRQGRQSSLSCLSSSKTNQQKSNLSKIKLPSDKQTTIFRYSFFFGIIQLGFLNLGIKVLQSKHSKI